MHVPLRHSRIRKIPLVERPTLRTLAVASADPDHRNIAKRGIGKYAELMCKNRADANFSCQLDSGCFWFAAIRGSAICMWTREAVYPWCPYGAENVFWVAASLVQWLLWLFKWLVPFWCFSRLEQYWIFLFYVFSHFWTSFKLTFPSEL